MWISCSTKFSHRILSVESINKDGMNRICDIKYFMTGHCEKFTGKFVVAPQLAG